MVSFAKNTVSPNVTFNSRTCTSRYGEEKLEYGKVKSSHLLTHGQHPTCALQRLKRNKHSMRKKNKYSHTRYSKNAARKTVRSCNQTCSINTIMCICTYCKLKLGQRCELCVRE